MCVQNLYNLARREDDALVDLTAQQGIAFVPYFPLGGFSPLQSDELSKVAGELGATPMSVALAWLLQRSPNILLIPGTSSVEHLRENVAGAALTLPADALAELDAIGGSARATVRTPWSRCTRPDLCTVTSGCARWERGGLSRRRTGAARRASAPSASGRSSVAGGDLVEQEAAALQDAGQLGARARRAARPARRRRWRRPATLRSSPRTPGRGPRRGEVPDGDGR